MAFVGVAAQMAVQAAILAAAGKNKDEIGKATVKTAISGTVGGAVGGGLGGGVVGEGIGGSLGGMVANAAYGENIGEGALMGGVAGAARGYAKAPADVKGMPTSVGEFGTNMKQALPDLTDAGRANFAKANAGYTDRFDITDPKTYMPTASQGGVNRVNAALDRATTAAQGVNTADPLGATQIENRAAQEGLAAARGLPITEKPSILLRITMVS